MKNVNKIDINDEKFSDDNIIGMKICLTIRSREDLMTTEATNSMLTGITDIPE